MSVEESSEAAGAENEQEETQETGIQSLGDLLAEQEESETSGEDDSEVKREQKKTELTKFNDLAGKLDIELDALYKLEVTSSEDGKPITVEQLKDSYSEAQDFELAKMEFEEQRVSQEQDLMRAQTELQEILRSLPKGAVNPATLEKIRARSEKAEVEERRKTLEVIGEWKDAKTREADIAGMSEQLQGYGFPVGYLKNVVDHRLLKYFRDSYKREQRMRAAIEKARAGKPAKSRTSKQQKTAPKKGASVTPKRGQSKLEATLLNLE